MCQNERDVESGWFGTWRWDLFQLNHPCGFQPNSVITDDGLVIPTKCASVQLRDTQIIKKLTGSHPCLVSGGKRIVLHHGRRHQEREPGYLENDLVVTWLGSCLLCFSCWSSGTWIRTCFAVLWSWSHGRFELQWAESVQWSDWKPYLKMTVLVTTRMELTWLAALLCSWGCLAGQILSCCYCLGWIDSCRWPSGTYWQRAVHPPACCLLTSVY